MPDSVEGIEVLTPGHFLVGGPLEALHDPPASFHSIPSAMVLVSGFDTPYLEALVCRVSRPAAQTQ